LPPPRSIGDLFPPTYESLKVLLTVPPYNPGGANCALQEDNHGRLRYVAEAGSFPDENTGMDEKPVKLGRKNIHFLFDTEPAEGLVTLPLAVIKRDGAGNYIFEERFIPPCVQIGANEYLLMLTRRLIDILQEKSATLSLDSRERGKFRTGFSAQEISKFWFLHSINSSLAPLRYLFLTKRGHPEELFRELSRLAGALCTFSIESHPRDLPLYNHLDLGGCFETLDQHIRTHLDLVVPSNCVSIPLKPRAKYFYEGDITDQRCLDRARWVFAIQAPIGDAEVIARTLQLVKICSAQFVPELVRRALPGMELTHLAVPPSAVSPKVESQYFAISRTGPCWDHIVQTRRVGVYIPGDLPKPEIELLVVLET
jgi:type VI secretion system protein ImpJ